MASRRGRRRLCRCDSVLCVVVSDRFCGQPKYQFIADKKRVTSLGTVFVE